METSDEPPAAKDLRRGLDSLSPEHREVLHLGFFEDLSDEDITALVGEGGSDGGFSGCHGRDVAEAAAMGAASNSLFTFFLATKSSPAGLFPPHLVIPT